MEEKTKNISVGAYCNVCSKHEVTMKRCTRCKNVIYCSRSCQIKDWPSHQKMCTKKNEMIGKKKTMTPGSKIALDIKETGMPDTYEKQSPIVADVDGKIYKVATDVIKGNTAENRKEMATVYEKTDVDTGADENNKQDFGLNAVNLIIKCQKKRHKLKIDRTLSGESLVELLSSTVHIPVNKLKLICKGKIMSAENIGLFVKDKAIFQAIGEVAESEDDLESGHVDCIMARLGVERNEAIRALRQTGDVVDAILYLGNR